MKKTALMMLFVPFYIFGQQPEISGSWSGTLDVMGNKLRIVFNITHEEQKYHSTMDSPDQFVTGIEMDSTFFDGKFLIISSKNLNAIFKGNLNDSMTAFSGNWQQSGLSFPLDIRKTNAKITINRPQNPLKPYPYIEKEVEFINQKAGIKLAGTFTYPEQKEAFPAIVMISGSGPQNRDEEVFGHKPFWVIADYLTRNGFGVLRFDDRGVGTSEGDFSNATSEDFATDVEAAVRFLKSQKNVIKDRIGLIGHSEGGLIAPMVAAKDTEIYFIILMAGPGTSGKEILIDQTALIMQSQGYHEDVIAKAVKENTRIYNMIMKSKNIDKTKKKLEKIIFKSMIEESPETIDQLSLEAKAKNQSDAICSPWFRFFLSYNPKETLQKVKCHVLAINGSLDVQVPAQKNTDAIIETLADAGNYNAERIIFKNLNHLFQTATTGSLQEYGQIEETIAPQVLESMKEWIVKLFK